MEDDDANTKTQKKREQNNTHTRNVNEDGESDKILYFQDFFFCDDMNTPSCVGVGDGGGGGGNCSDVNNTVVKGGGVNKEHTKSKKNNSLNKIKRMDTAEKFFELANAPIVGYRIKLSRKKMKKRMQKSKSVTTPAILIKQDNSCQSHTGGIVWETSYLLACFLSAKYDHNYDNIDDNKNKKVKKKKPLGKTLEVGSGCGMLGLILATSGLCTKVIMTETNEVMENLRRNVEYNTMTVRTPRASSESSSESTKTSATISPFICSSKKISVHQLRWDALKQDIENCKSSVTSTAKNSNGNHDLEPHTFDTIIGTDVIFSSTLVKPLLKTLQKMSHERTNIYLCVQIRCEDSHALFLKKASKYDFKCTDITDELKDYPSCEFGLELECKIFHLSVNKDVKSNSSITNKKRSMIEESVMEKKSKRPKILK